MLADVSRDCAHPSGRWQRAPDDDRVDAALLLASLHGAIPVDDPRGRATHRAVLDELADDHFLYRFRHDDRPPASAEGAFLLCGFWMARSLLVQGDRVEAARWFERNRAACGPPAIFSEEFDVGERQLRGNLPQAFVHAGLLECAAELSGALAEGEQ
jgi:GH15 family glucan-1,4-alpha-glucosidase